MDIITLLNIILAIVVVLILALGGLAIFMIMKSKKAKNTISDTNSAPKQKSAEGTRLQGIESMSKFMEFDDILDNMIIRKDRQQYLMVLQCKGINYDLLADEEKVAVENGFVQFLNTLRYPVQLYVQTRSLNLRDIVDQYRTKVAEVKDEVLKLDEQIKKEKANGNIKLVQRMEFDRRRKMNVLEYGTDISEYVARMSQNRNVLQQNTYIVVSYYTAEFGGNISNYSKSEIDNIAFSELYTRAQTVIRSIASAGVSGRVMDSEELVELLYVAYNRDDSEILNLKKAFDAGYNSLYSTAKDVLEKKKELIQDQIGAAAVQFATDSITKADNLRKLKKVHKDEIKQKANELVDMYRAEMDDDLYNETKKQIEKNSVTDDGTEQSENEKPQEETVLKKFRTKDGRIVTRRVPVSEVEAKRKAMAEKKKAEERAAQARKRAIS